MELPAIVASVLRRIMLRQVEGRITAKGHRLWRLVIIRIAFIIGPQAWILPSQIFGVSAWLSGIVIIPSWHGLGPSSATLVYNQPGPGPANLWNRQQWPTAGSLQWRRPTGNVRNCSEAR